MPIQAESVNSLHIWSSGDNMAYDLIITPHWPNYHHNELIRTNENTAFLLITWQIPWEKYTNPANGQFNFCMQKLWAPPMVPIGLEVYHVVLT